MPSTEFKNLSRSAKNNLLRTARKKNVKVHVERHGSVYTVTIMCSTDELSF